MKLSHWAKKQGITYQTAFKLFKTGKLPCKATQLATGTILVEEGQPLNQNHLKTFIYCRVSHNNQKEDLQKQVERCQAFCAASGWPVEKVYKEIASGMNDNRKNLLTLIDNTPKRIVVEHKDRLTRFGFNYFNHILPLLGYELVVINKEFEEENDLIKDMKLAIEHFCCKLHGLKLGKEKMKNIISFIQEK